MIVTRGLGRNGTAKTTLALGGYGRVQTIAMPGWISATLTGTGTLVATGSGALLGELRATLAGSGAFAGLLVGPDYSLSGQPVTSRRFFRRQ